ncbi:MAG: stalk domain-containing protein [Armatimonadota bacterium]
MSGGALAVILLLNGVQIGLPAPAFVQDGRTWYPARAVLTTAGFDVTYEEAGHRVVVGRSKPLFSVDMESLRITADADTSLNSVQARRSDGVLFLPVQTLCAIGLQVRWDNENKLLDLQSPQNAPASLSIRDVLKNPLKWLSRSIRLHGEYVGLEGVMSSSDRARTLWRLRGEDNSILCADTPAAGLRRMPLQPFERVVVTGHLRMMTDATVYLDVEQRKPAQGPASVGVTMVTDRERYQPGDTVLVEVEWNNILDKPMKVATPPLLLIVNHLAQEVWQQRLNIPETLPPHERSLQAFKWLIPDDAPHGTYRLQLSHADLWAYQCPFEVGEAQ